MQLSRWTITLFLLFLVSCHGNPPFDFSSNWNWHQLRSYAVTKATKATIDSLENLIVIEDARYLLKKLDQLQTPTDIQDLETIEANQISAGGGFYGILPVFFQDSIKIPIPNSFDSKIETALFLAKQRKRVLEVIDSPSFPYNRKFSGQKIDRKPIKPFTSELTLKVDISAIKTVLDYYTNSSEKEKNIMAIANNPVYKSMLQHRRNLGYLPEPLPTTEDLADFIKNSCHESPVYQLWNWINPCNFFCFSDLYLNRSTYRDFIEYIQENRDQLEYQLLSKIDRYTPDNFTFSDQISFGVNFGIRSWATQDAIGTNIVQVKDDFNALLRTMRHEVFHHVQLSLTTLSPNITSKDNPDFSDLTYWNFESNKDKKFYEVLAYIFLEGTATYIGGLYPEMDVKELTTEGIELLNKVYKAIYDNNEMDKVNQLLTKGLKSNGPFYALGYTVTSTIEQKSGAKKIQKILQQGPIDFFRHYSQLKPTSGLNKQTQLKINYLYKEMNDLEK